jgi:hypothetical protein
MAYRAFRATLLEFGSSDRPYQILVLWIKGRPGIVLPLLDTLSPRKVQAACVHFWQQVPELPDPETWRLTVNRWLTDIKPYG